MKLFFLSIASFFCLHSYSQTITVMDKSTGKPVPGVFIHGKTSISLTSDSNGKVDISSLAKEESISIGNSMYKTRTYSFAQLENAGFKVELELSGLALSAVVVSTNRWRKETPYRIESISMKEVAFQNPQTTADLLGTSGYAFIQKSQLGGGSPMIRGMAANRVLMVVDGVRMNNAIFRAGNLQNVISLDANALESTEILFGPGSVKYGSDAIGGVMNFITLEPKLSDTAHKAFVSGNALMRTSTANAENTAHVDLNIGFKKLAFVTSFTRSKYDDLRSGTVGGDPWFYRRNFVQTIDDKDYMVPNKDSALQVGSKYDQINFMQKVLFKPDRSWDFEYGFHFSETSPYNRYDRLYVMQTAGPYKNKLRWAEWYYGPQKWNMQRIGIIHSKPNVVYNHLSIIGAIQNFEESRFDREFMVRELRMQKETVKAYSLNLDLDRTVGPRATFYYGAELVENQVASFASLTHVITDEVDSTVTRYPDGSIWRSSGAYVNLKYQLMRKLVINGGVRYSSYKIKANFDTTYFPFPFVDAEMSNHTANGSLGFVYSPQKNWDIYLNGATGFRAPNIDDMGKVFESTPGYLVVPNPSLKPEHAYNAEIGSIKSFGKILKIDFAGYYTRINDAMERKDFLLNGRNTIRYLGNSSKIQAVQNVTEIRVHGIQAGIEFNYKGIGLKSSFSYQEGKEQSPDSLIYYPLRHAAPTFGSTHLTWQHKKLKLDLYAIYNGKMDFEDLALTERVNPSYARDYSSSKTGLAYVSSWHTLNFKAAFYLNQHVSLMAGIENIGDKLYRPYSSGINAPGRNIIAALRASF